MPQEAKISALYNEGKKQEAFQVLVNSYSTMVYSHVYKMTNNKSDTKDIAQNAFLKAWKYFDNFQQKSKFSTWLFRIASNECYTFLNKRKLSVDIDNIPIQTDQSISPTTDPAKILQEALAILPTKQKQVFVMRYYDELKYDAMSDILGTSVGALKASYHIAVKKIEEFVKQY